MFTQFTKRDDSVKLRAANESSSFLDEIFNTSEMHRNMHKRMADYYIDQLSRSLKSLRPDPPLDASHEPPKPSPLYDPAYKLESNVPFNINAHITISPPPVIPPHMSPLVAPPLNNTQTKENTPEPMDINDPSPFVSGSHIPSPFVSGSPIPSPFVSGSPIPSPFVSGSHIPSPFVSGSTSVLGPIYTPKYSRSTRSTTPPLNSSLSTNVADPTLTLAPDPTIATNIFTPILTPTNTATLSPTASTSVYSPTKSYTNDDWNNKSFYDKLTPMRQSDKISRIKFTAEQFDEAMNNYVPFIAYPPLSTYYSRLIYYTEPAYTLEIELFNSINGMDDIPTILYSDMYDKSFDADIDFQTSIVPPDVLNVINMIMVGKIKQYYLTADEKNKKKYKDDYLACIQLIAHSCKHLMSVQALILLRNYTFSELITRIKMVKSAPTSSKPKTTLVEKQLVSLLDTVITTGSDDAILNNMNIEINKFKDEIYVGNRDKLKKILELTAYKVDMSRIATLAQDIQKFKVSDDSLDILSETVSIMAMCNYVMRHLRVYNDKINSTAYVDKKNELIEFSSQCQSVLFLILTGIYVKEVKKFAYVPSINDDTLLMNAYTILNKRTEHELNANELIYLNMLKYVKNNVNETELLHYITKNTPGMVMANLKISENLKKLGIMVYNDLAFNYGKSSIATSNPSIQNNLNIKLEAMLETSSNFKPNLSSILPVVNNKTGYAYIFVTLQDENIISFKINIVSAQIESEDGTLVHEAVYDDIFITLPPLLSSKVIYANPFNNQLYPNSKPKLAKGISYNSLTDHVGAWYIKKRLYLF